MERYYFTFRSVTAAMEGQERLKRAGIRAGMVRTPGPLRKKGCGYCLYVSPDSLQAAEAVLRRTRIPYERMYRRTRDGRWQEMTS